MSVDQAGDMKFVLVQEFDARRRKNARYSLRAYARDLGIEPSALLKVLKGQRRLTPKTYERIAGRLHRGITRGQILRARPGWHTPVELETFKVLSEWQHFALLELLRCENFEPSIQSISARLELSEETVSASVARLKELGLLEISEQGEWIDRSGNLSTVHMGEVSAQALRSYHNQILRMASESLEHTPIQERDNSSMVFAAPEQLMPEIKDRIKKFRRELVSWIESQPKASQVYQLAICMYPVTVSLPSQAKEKP